MFVLRLVSIFISAVLIFGCDDPKSASKSNFQAALQAYYDNHPVCIWLPTGVFERSTGGIINLWAKSSRYFSQRSKPDSARMEALTEAGLFTRSIHQFSTRTETSEFIRYTPTDMSKAVLKDGKICFARRNISENLSYTEPAAYAGVKVSRVTFRYTLKDVYGWAKSAAVIAAYPMFKEALEGISTEDTAVLVLTNEGWKRK